MSSYGANSEIDGVTSAEPMINAGLPSVDTSEDNGNRGKRSASHGCQSWTVVLAFTITILVALFVGAAILLVNASQVKAIYKPETTVSEKPESQAIKQEATVKEFKLEYDNGDKSTEQVIINVKDNYTELFAADITVYNYFKKRISLHRVDVSPGIQVCLIKSMDREVQPKELEEALSEVKGIYVNSSKLYVIDSTPVPDMTKDDMTVHQFCDSAKIYSLKQVDPLGPDVGLTMEELRMQLSGRYKRQIRSQGSPRLECGGGTGPLPAISYKCTKKNSYCYKSLVNERCEVCYHSPSVRTSGCWCPVQAIETCIQITYKPAERICCGVDVLPCIRSECDKTRVPYVPVPIITVKTINNP
ncbi:uncharacterized protein [Watersipora subatra]|uniref:uncharacterized protein n=1 Tax=Watersipora subatra TaxID=2589382 RepID=UPI00355C95E9